MSSITSIAGYNGKGTQGLVATDKLDNNTRSAFWNENDTTKTLVYGAAIVEVNSGGIDKPGSSKSWTFDNDPDVISNIYLRIEIPLDQYFENITPAALSTYLFDGFGGMGMLNIIDRIDIKVGNQIWYTTDRKSIFDNLFSEENAVGILKTLQGSFVKSKTNSKIRVGGAVDPELQPGLYVECMIPLEMLKTKSQYNPSITNINEGGHIFCAAPDQQFTVQVYFSDGKANKGNSAASGPIFFPTGNEDLDTYKFTTSLYYKQINVCNIERKLLTENSLAKRFKTSQYISNIKVSDGLTKVDCSHFNIYGSYLIVGCSQNNKFIEKAIFGGNLYPTRPSFDFNLKINNVSIGYFTDIFCSTLSSNYLSIREYSSGYSTLGETFPVSWVIPLSSTAFGASSIPLNRFDSIVLEIIPKSAISIGSTEDDNISGFTVTCVGETTVLYENGTATMTSY